MEIKVGAEDESFAADHFFINYFGKSGGREA